MQMQVHEEMDSIKKGLQGILGKNVSFSIAMEERYSADKSYMKPQVPIAVAFPSSTSQVSRLLRFCNRHRIGVTARGAGTSLTGASIPSKGAIVVSMEKMGRVLEINIEDQYVVAQPAVVLDDLNHRLEKHGYFYPPDPGSSMVSTVGGTLSTNAGGLRGVMFGSTRRWVLGAQAVLADGTVIETGSRTLKLSRGYDLTSLLVGSEGTLAVITKAVLRIEPQHGRMGSIVAYYDRMESACGMLRSLRNAGMPIITAEFIDRRSMKYMDRKYRGQPGYMVIIGIASYSASLAHDMRLAASIVRKSGPESFYATTSKARVRGELGSRKRLFDAMAARCRESGLDMVIGDVIVPPSRLCAAVREVEKMAGRYGPGAAMFGHMGEGNRHLNIFADLGNRKHAALANRLLNSLGEIAVRHAGSISAEHGIGLEKKKLLREELDAIHSSKEIELMKGIKKAFDPKGILNPGKIFD
jgi:glycolate oxidase